MFVANSSIDLRVSKDRVSNTTPLTIFYMYEYNSGHCVDLHVQPISREITFPTNHQTLSYPITRETITTSPYTSRKSKFCPHSNRKVVPTLLEVATRLPELTKAKKLIAIVLIISVSQPPGPIGPQNDNAVAEKSWVTYASSW